MADRVAGGSRGDGSDRSEAEVERSLAGVDATSLAFLIDDLHRANDSLSVGKTDEAMRLRALEGLIPVHGPGIVMLIDASGLTALDLQDALNNLAAGGAETSDGVTVDGVVVVPPWKISVIGDADRLSGVADLMLQHLRADRRVRSASYRVDGDLVIRSVISEKPFVYAVASQNR